MKKSILIIKLLLLFIGSSAQDQDLFKTTSYKIRGRLQQQIDKWPAVKTGVLKESLWLKVYWNGKADINYYDKNKPLDCYTESALINDTFFIYGYMPGRWYGFELILFKDSCLVSTFVSTDSTLYKLKRSDKVQTKFLDVPCIAPEIILSTKPRFKEGEIVSGWVDLKSQEYYYQSKKYDGVNNIHITAYFKTAPIKKRKR